MRTCMWQTRSCRNICGVNYDYWCIWTFHISGAINFSPMFYKIIHVTTSSFSCTRKYLMQNRTLSYVHRLAFLPRPFISSGARVMPPLVWDPCIALINVSMTSNCVLTIYYFLLQLKLLNFFVIRFTHRRIPAREAFSAWYGQKSGCVLAIL